MQIDIVYVNAHRAFDARFLEVAQSFGSAVRIAVGAAALARLTREKVFVSPTQPNVIVVRDGEVVAQAIGLVSAHELDVLIGGAVAA